MRHLPDAPRSSDPVRGYHKVVSAYWDFYGPGLGGWIMCPVNPEHYRLLTRDDLTEIGEAAHDLVVASKRACPGCVRVWHHAVFMLRIFE